MKKNLLLFLIIFCLSGCTQEKFVGKIGKATPKEYNPYPGYCFTSDDGKFDCVYIGDENGNQMNNELEQYAGKKVIIYGKEHTGPVMIKFPVMIDVDSIKVIED